MQALKAILKCPKCWGMFILFFGFLYLRYRTPNNPVPKVTTPIMAYQADSIPILDYVATCSGADCFVQIPVAASATASNTTGWTTITVPSSSSGTINSQAETIPEPEPVRIWPLNTAGCK